MSLCFLFSLLIKTCNVYIVREQTEPWLVLPCPRKWVSCTFGCSFVFLVIMDPTLLPRRESVSGCRWTGQALPPLISLKPLLCLPAAPLPVPDLPRQPPAPSGPSCMPSALALSRVLATSVSTSLPPPLFLSNRALFFHNSGGSKSQIEVLVGGFCLGGRWPPSSCSHIVFPLCVPGS